MTNLKLYIKNRVALFLRGLIHRDDVKQTIIDIFNMDEVLRQHKSSVLNIIREESIVERSRERFFRQEFFYNAFKALTFNGISGDYLEFGCCGCTTFSLAYHESRRHGRQTHMWAFDSFQGLPDQKGDKDEHPRWIKGNMKISLDDFHYACGHAGIPRDVYTVVPGYYDETLLKLSSENSPNDVALAYIDCDLYTSTMSVLQFLSPRLKHGAIIAFDDYYCWSDSQISGERQAMLEIFSNISTLRLIPYIQFGWHGQSFVVERVDISNN